MGGLTDPEIIFFAESMFGKLLPGSKLYTGSMTLFRKQWNSVMQRLGVPHTQAENGATPGVLRGSGATFFYQQTGDLAWVAWRGRWSRTRTLEYYLQEVGAFVLIHNLDSVSKTRISILSQFAWPVLHSFSGFAMQYWGSRIALLNLAFGLRLSLRMSCVVVAGIPSFFTSWPISAQPTREILSLQAKRDDLLSLDRWKNQSWLAAFSGPYPHTTHFLDSTFESCIWIEIEFEDELCCGGWNSILFHQLANSAQPTREILSLQAKRDIYIYM